MVYMIALRKPDNNDELPVYFYPSSSSTTLSISSRSSLAHPSQIHAIPLLMIPLSRQSKTSSLMCLSFSFSRASYLSTHPPLYLTRIVLGPTTIFVQGFFKVC